MLQKTPKSTISFGNIFRTGFKIVLVAEVAAFLASYAVWHRMNTNQEFRKYFNDNYPSALEGFYRFSGFLGADIDLARKVDQASWGKSQTKSE